MLTQIRALEVALTLRTFLSPMMTGCLLDVLMLSKVSSATMWKITCVSHKLLWRVR